MTVYEAPRIRSDWLKTTQEDPIDPDYPVVDAHHHLYDDEARKYWIQEYAQDLVSGHNVVASVYVECASAYRSAGPSYLHSLGETAAIAQIARQQHGTGKPALCSAIVSRVDLTLGNAAYDVLCAHIEAGDGRVRGIRHATVYDTEVKVPTKLTPPVEGVMRSREYRDGVACLGRLNLSLDVWAYHPQLDELVELAQEFPDVRFVVNHIGGILGLGRYQHRREQAFKEWRYGLARLAALPNCHIKIGGLGMHVFGFHLHERPRPASSSELAQLWSPYVKSCVDLFGPSRCMFESNFPVDKAYFNYVTLWNAFKRLTATYSEHERKMMLRDTAVDFYRLTSVKSEPS